MCRFYFSRCGADFGISLCGDIGHDIDVFRGAAPVVIVEPVVHAVQNIDNLDHTVNQLVLLLQLFSLQIEVLKAERNEGEVGGKRAKQ